MLIPLNEHTLTQVGETAAPRLGQGSGSDHIQTRTGRLIAGITRHGNLSETAVDPAARVGHMVGASRKSNGCRPNDQPGAVDGNSLRRGLSHGAKGWVPHDCEPTHGAIAGVSTKIRRPQITITGCISDG